MCQGRLTRNFTDFTGRNSMGMQSPGNMQSLYCGSFSCSITFPMSLQGSQQQETSQSNGSENMVSRKWIFICWVPITRWKRPRSLIVMYSLKTGTKMQLSWHFRASRFFLWTAATTENHLFQELQELQTGWISTRKLKQSSLKSKN